MSSTFDTLDAAREMKAAGIDEDQAEAIALQMGRASKADRDELGTRVEFYRGLLIHGAVIITAMSAMKFFG